MTAEPVPSRTSSRRTSTTGAPLPRRAPADPTDETERLRDWGVLTSVLEALTADEVERCRGTLVVHADGRVECLESARCPSDRAMHPGTATCAEVLGDCC